MISVGNGGNPVSPVCPLDGQTRLLRGMAPAGGARVRESIPIEHRSERSPLRVRRGYLGSDPMASRIREAISLSLTTNRAKSGCAMLIASPSCSMSQTRWRSFQT